MKVQNSQSQAGADGGKWVCDPRFMERKKCLVYSFGSNVDYTFELGIHERLSCEVHIFDPFNIGTPPDDMSTLIRVHKMGIATADARRDWPKYWSKNTTFHTLPSIIGMLGHQGRDIDILKIDIDGIEFGLLDQQEFWDSIRRMNVSIDQLLLDAYRFRGDSGQKNPVTSGSQIDKVIRFVISQGFVMFHKEVNSNDACGFSFVRLNISCKFDYALLHPPALSAPIAINVQHRSLRSASTENYDGKPLSLNEIIKFNGTVRAIKGSHLSL